MNVKLVLNNPLYYWFLFNKSDQFLKVIRLIIYELVVDYKENKRLHKRLVQSEKHKNEYLEQLLKEK
ncbi:hypothetical protein AB674_21345 [Flavobacterium sp. ABG]|nr:hypothetical protein AB674_21345 [Flavobacterium sp. ABG]